MENAAMAILFFNLCFFLPSLAESGSSVPALYIFGDSIVDVGNNNNQNTPAQANYLPYGIDFPQKATGRFTNGYTMPDFFAEFLHLPLSRAYMNCDFRMEKSLTGFNYASASSGILDDTSFWWNLNMKKQVYLFNKTIGEYLSLHYKNRSKLSGYLSESIFLLHSGTNDYLLNYYRNNISHKYTPDAFATLLVNELGFHLQSLYKAGAKKFLVFEISPLGCLPGIINLHKPITTRCVDEINDAVSVFNKKLPTKLTELNSKLKASTFVIAKSYHLLYDVVLNPTKYGLKDSRNPCCPGCKPNQVPCGNRESYVFWDDVHPTQAAFNLIATKCFYGSTLCTPVGTQQQQLVQN